MRKISRILGLGVAAAVAGTIGWNAFAQAPMRGGPEGFGPGMMMGGWHGPMSAGFADPTTQFAALKSELDITPEQQSAWDAYSKVVQDTVSSMQAQHQSIDMTAVHDMSWQDRQAFMAQMRDQHLEAFHSVNTAAQQLLTALNDTQKTKAKEILPGLAAHGFGMMQHAMMGWQPTR